jgi:glycosyltransferase involved in cell wall biosynthesis
MISRSHDSVETSLIGIQPRSHAPVRVLHSVGHLLRGGIEKWLFQMLSSQLFEGVEHHVLVRTEQEEAFTPAFREAGIPVLVCADFTNPVQYAQDFKRLVREHGPYDILHVHGNSFTGLLGLALAKAAGIPRTIVHSHCDLGPFLKERGYLYRAYVFGVLKAYRALADCGFAVSSVAAESMFGAGWETDKRWELLFCGIDCKPFDKPRDPALRAGLGIAPEAFVIGHVGRFREQKNHAFLIKIVQAAVALDPSVHCLLIGDGPLREQVTAEIRRCQLQDHFTLVPDTATPADYMISAMDCFVLPSLYEGLPLVAVEAQAAGLSCFISDHLAAEAVVDTSLVRLLPLQRSATDWAEAILSLKHRQPSSAGSPHSQVKSSRFNLDHCIATLRTHYVELARPKRSEHSTQT